MYKIQTFTRVRETKGTWVYQEVDEEGIPKAQNDPTLMVGVLYVRKNTFSNPHAAPQKIQVSIDDDGQG
jgi:hypothetical protein